MCACVQLTWGDASGRVMAVTPVAEALRTGVISPGEAERATAAREVLVRATVVMRVLVRERGAVTLQVGIRGRKLMYMCVNDLCICASVHRACALDVLGLYLCVWPPLDKLAPSPCFFGSARR